MQIGLGDYATCNVTINTENRVRLTGALSKAFAGETVISWWAACPAEYRSSYAGSGLPFPSPEVAYDNTPNHGELVLSRDETSFSFELDAMPNAYYVGNGTLYLEPNLQLRIRQGADAAQFQIKLNDGIPYRHLTYPGQKGVIARTGPEFYNGRFELPFANQETILRRSAYPVRYGMPQNYWGAVTPHP